MFKTVQEAYREESRLFPMYEVWFHADFEDNFLEWVQILPGRKYGKKVRYKILDDEGNLEFYEEF